MLAVIRRMKNKFNILLLIGVLFQFTYGCSVEWTEAIRSGEVVQNQFRETVDIDIRKGLIFLPVIIEEKEYRFLFDSGAPFSISKQLQNDHAFEIVSEGNIIDSDHNRKCLLGHQIWPLVSVFQVGFKHCFSVITAFSRHTYSQTGNLEDWLRMKICRNLLRE